MSPYLRLLSAEALKIRRSPALRLVWLMPLLFVGLEFVIFERPFLSIRAASPEVKTALGHLQVKMLVALWAGFFHPLMLALLPALVFRPEHQHRTWRHLHAQPVSRRTLFLAKATVTLLLASTALVLLWLMLWIERLLLTSLNPSLAVPFQAGHTANALGWLWLGSLPLLALYLWTSDRINSLAVPVVFGLLGLLLTVALTGQELNQPWRRDLIPWVLPYAASERVIHTGPGQQEAHMVARPLQPEPNVLRLPSGRKIRTWQNIPDEVLFPPPPPTPHWVMAAFAMGAGLFLALLGWVDAGRDRA
ncbi:MAG TPA: ABC transporter permease [Holophagaceae bacterium]